MDILNILVIIIWRTLIRKKCNHMIVNIVPSRVIFVKKKKYSAQNRTKSLLFAVDWKEGSLSSWNRNHFSLDTNEKCTHIKWTNWSTYHIHIICVCSLFWQNRFAAKQYRNILSDLECALERMSPFRIYYFRRNFQAIHSRYIHRHTQASTTQTDDSHSGFSVYTYSSMNSISVQGEISIRINSQNIRIRFLYKYKV